MLYLVATPIGNLGDISLRALEVLRAVDAVASEDTRKTGLLLKHFDVKKPQIAFHEHNEDRAGAHHGPATGRAVGGRCLQRRHAGRGRPRLHTGAAGHRADLPVTMVPGASALVMALVLSGLPSHSFTFRGFPPRKSGKRQSFLAVDRDSHRTLIFYGPHRLAEFLADALAVYGDRPAAIAQRTDQAV